MLSRKKKKKEREKYSISLKTSNYYTKDNFEDRVKKKTEHKTHKKTPQAF